MYQPGVENKEISVQVELPKGYDVSIKPQAWSCSDVAGLQLHVTIDNVIKNNDLFLEYNAAAIISPSVISPSHYKALLDVDKRLSHKRARTVMLTKKK